MLYITIIPDHNQKLFVEKVFSVFFEIEKFNNEYGSYGEFNLKIDEFYIM
jgi:hypothetical protein